MKRIRRFGLQLLILANCMFLLSSVTPIFGLQQVTIRNNFSDYKDSNGYLHIVGEVENLGSVDTKNVKIIATCYDSNDTDFHTDSNYTSLSVVPANRRAPFHLLIKPAVAVKVSRFNLTVNFQNASESLPRTLLILSNSSNMYSGFLNILGEVQNNGTQTSHFTKVVVTCYDKNGTVVAVDNTYTEPRDLAVGAKAPFKAITSAQQSPLVTRYEVQVQSDEAVLVPEFSSIILVIISTCFLAVLLTMKRTTHRYCQRARSVILVINQDLSGVR